MRANRRDANEPEIVEFFRKSGGYWQPCNRDQGHDGNLYIHGKTFAVEIKDGEKPPSEQELTEREVTFRAALNCRGVTLWIVRDIADAYALIESARET